MIEFCISKDRNFLEKAKRLNISPETLEQITNKYYIETQSIDNEPSDTYIRAQLGNLPYVDANLYEKAKQVWDLYYSKPLVFNTSEEQVAAKKEAELLFLPSAVHTYTDSNGKFVLRVQEPVKKLDVKYRKDFSSWKEYNDYLLYYKDAIPEEERQYEEKKRGQQPFTFNDGITVTAPFQPNEQQIEALNAMSDFINSDETTMTLSGYAGTGKTSLMEMLAAKMKKQRRNIVFSASTNKAAAVLRDRVKKSGFTAQTLNKVFGIQVEVDNSKPYDASNLVNKLRDANIDPGTVVVIDESSMINEENYNILNGIAAKNGLKIIYVGDKGQLAPVKETKVSKVFRDNNGRIVTLTKVERTDDNAILKEATALRNGQALSGESSFNKEGKGVAYIRSTNETAKEALIRRFIPMLKKNPDYFRILAYTNEAVAAYNRDVREALGYTDNTPRVGEPILGYSNWGEEYDRSTRQKTYRVINSESYKVVKVGKPRQVYKTIGNNTKVELTAVPITIEDAMGKRDTIDFMDVKENQQNRQAVTQLAKEKARLHNEASEAYKRGNKKAYSALKDAENEIEKFLFINDNIYNEDTVNKDGKHPKLHAKTFDFGYAMTVHKSQGSTFTHVLIDDTDIAKAKRQDGLNEDSDFYETGNPYDSLETAKDVDLGFDGTTTEKVSSTSDNLISQAPVPEGLNATTINRAADEIRNPRQNLEYVAVSRATDTATIISNNVKSEDSPLNHMSKDSTVKPQQTLPQVHEEFYTKQEAQNYINNLVADGVDRNSIQLKHVPATETEDDYYVVSTIQPDNIDKEITQQMISHLEEIFKTAGNVKYEDDIQRFIDEHPDWAGRVQTSTFGIDKSYLNYEYPDIIPELQNVVNNNKYNKAGTDVVILEKDPQTIYLIDHSNQKEFEVHKKQGRHGVGIRNVFKLNELTKDDVLEIIRNVSPRYDYSSARIYHALQTIGLTKEHLDSISLDAELQRIIDSNNEIYGRDRRNWPSGGYGSGRYYNNVRESGNRTEGGLGQEELQLSIDSTTIPPLPVGNPLSKDLYQAEVAYEETIQELNKTQKLLHGKSYEASLSTKEGDIQIDQYVSRKDDDTIDLSSGTSIFNMVNLSIQANIRKNLIGGTILFPSKHINEKDKNYTRLDNPIKSNHAGILKTVLSHFIKAGERYPSSEWQYYSSTDGYKNRIDALSEALGLNLSSYFQFELSEPFYKTDNKGKQHKMYKERVVVDAEKLSKALPTLRPVEYYSEIEKALDFNEQDRDIYVLRMKGLTNQYKTLSDKAKTQWDEITRIRKEIQKEESKYTDLPFYKTDKGEVYGFVDSKDNLYLDRRVITAEHPIHEYTHLWDRYVAKKNPEFWKTGVDIMKKTSLWQEVLNDDNYGKRWQEMQGMTPEKLEGLIASEVHARLTGVRGKEILDSLAKEKGAKGIIAKLKQWLLDFWKELKSAFTPWSKDELDALKNLPIDEALEKLTVMTVKDFAEGVNPITQEMQEQQNTLQNLTITPAQAADKKAAAKGSISNKFIGFAEDIKGSSTAEYARQAGDRANVGVYSHEDTVFVSIPGMRGNAEIRHREQQKTINEALKALHQGATLITDNEAYTNSSSYNEGEKRLAQALKTVGAIYSERTVDGQVLGVWKLQQPAQTTTPIAQGNNLSDQGTVSTDQGNNIAEQETAEGFQPQAISLPWYEQMRGLDEMSVVVDAEWKMEHLQILDDELDPDNPDEENARILEQMDRVIEAPSEEEYNKAPTKEDEELNNRMLDYEKRNQQLNNLLENKVGLKASEIRETAETIMNTISDIITELQQHPERATQYWPDYKPGESIDLSKATRKGIVQSVNINRLIALAKKRFDDLKWSDDPVVDALYNSAHLLDQHDLIIANWDAVMRFAGDIFAANEGFGIKRNSKNHNYEAKEQEYVGYDTDDYSSPQDEDAIREEGDEQEHWQIEAKTIAVINSMSELVKMGFHNCYVLDSNGNKVLDKWGIPKRVSMDEAVKKILFWTIGATDLDDMVNKIEAKKSTNPWVIQLTKRLSDRSGNEADFQSQFYGVMHRHYQLFGIGQYDKGHFISKILNRHKALSDVKKSIAAKFQMHEHPLFNKDTTINKESLNELEGWYKELNQILQRYHIYEAEDHDRDGNVTKFLASDNRELSDEDIEAAAKNIVAISRMLGFQTTEEAVIPVITKKSLNDMTVAIRLMLYKDGLKAQEKLGGTDYRPFEFKAKNSIDGALEKFLKPIVEELEETALNTIFEDGKMYQSNVIPSFLTQLFDSFSLPEERFIPWVESFYGTSQWFKNEDGWRTPWLKTLVEGVKGSMSPEDVRRMFEHHIQLNFNKHNYMRTLSPEEYIISCLTNYFFSKTDNKNPDLTPAWFRVPIQSNKPSSEFIKFFSYRGVDYKNKIIDGMMSFYRQELSRIDTVRKRNKQEDDASTISSWDKNGRKFMFLPFLNAYLIDRDEVVAKQGNDLLRKADSTVDVERNNELKKLLNKKLNAEEGLSSEEDTRLIELVKEAAYNYMQEKVNMILDSYDRSGILKAAEKIENIKEGGRTVRQNVENFLWNDFFAANNILQLTIVDKAFYDSSIEMQKRLAELHASGTKPNKKATDYKGNPVSDGNYRTLVINDLEDFTSSIIENISEIFDREIERAPKDEQASWEALKESLVGKEGRFRKINVTDGQAYSCPSSYRKKAFMFGKWSPEAEELYWKLRNNNYKPVDVETMLQVLKPENPIEKPFVYGFLKKIMGVQNAPIQEMNVPFQAKNSEYLLIIADALMRGQDTKRPNMLKVIFDLMEESERLMPTKGIDTVQFKSAIKSGGQGIIDLNSFMYSPTGEAEAAVALRNQVFVKDDKGNVIDYDYDTFIQSTDYDNYALQQIIPKHFQEHTQLEPSQKRANIMSDLDMWIDPKGDINDPANINYYTWKDPDGTEHKLTAREFREEYERVHAENIREGLEELAELFKLKSNDRKVRNMALSELLQEEIESSPRYGVDLMQACQIDPRTGEFRIPKGDPIQSKRIEQLINSIIKSRVNKQKLAGGPVVQVTNWGTSKQLHIRFNDHEGNIIPLEQDYNPEEHNGKSYKEYLKENQAGIAHFEVFAPAAYKKILEKFRNPDGTINLEAVEKCDPNLLRLITCRIPNEDKYSIAHGKIVGFMPEKAGEAIMFPYDLTEIDDSDFDVDKRYCFFFEIDDIVPDEAKIRKKLTDRLTQSIKNFKQNKKEQYEKWAKKRKREGQSDRDIAEIEVDTFLHNIGKEENNDPLTKSMQREYDRILKEEFTYKVKYPKKGTRADRNNQILSMDWAVMSNERTAPKVLNPGGFEIPKHNAYVIAAYRAKDGKTAWDELEVKTTKQLKNLIPSDMDLGWFDAQVQFYKQNMAGSNLIGVFAVNKVAHAFLEADDILVDIEQICGSSFTIAGFEFTGRIKVDPSRDRKGSYVGKGLGSMVGASADAAKDPWLDYIGVNMTTAAVFNTLFRLGMPEENAALFMSQDVISSVIREQGRENLENPKSPITLNAIIEKKLGILGNKNNGLLKNSKAATEELTIEELRKGLLSSDKFMDKAEKDKIDYKVLLAFSKLQNLARAMRKPTLITRLNSISAAAGPLIIDNIILEYKLAEFLDSNNDNGTGFYRSDGSPIDMDTILEMHPMLKEFSKAIDSREPDCPSRILFSDMPAGSEAFKTLRDALPSYIKDKIYDDRNLLSKLSDFFQSYMLVAEGIINPDHLSHYMPHNIQTSNGKVVRSTGFPGHFMGSSKDSKSMWEKYPDNAFIQAIEPTFDKKTGIGRLEINTTGMSEREKEKLRMAWTDLHKTDPVLSTMLFTYAFFRGGIGFSPKTWMGLVPTYVKEHLTTTRKDGTKTSYVDTYRTFPSDMIYEYIIDQFVRNNWNNSKLAPEKGGEGAHYDYSQMSEGKLFVRASEDVSSVKNLMYMRTEENGKTYLWRNVILWESALLGENIDMDKVKDVEFQRVMPLGNNGEYVEMYLDDSSNRALETVEDTNDREEQDELPEVSQKDMADNQDSDPVTPQVPVEQQAKNITNVAEAVMEMWHTDEKTAQNFIEAKKKELNEVDEGKRKALIKSTPQTLQRIAAQMGYSFNEEQAVEWFKKLC